MKNMVLMLKMDHKNESVVFNTALSLARSCGARLHVIHAIDLTLRDPDERDTEIKKETQRAEEEFKAMYVPKMEDYNRFSFTTVVGDPANETARFARNIHADMVVVGCHFLKDKPSFNRIGETGAAILQWSPCPVLMVPCGMS